VQAVSEVGASLEESRVHTRPGWSACWRFCAAWCGCHHDRRPTDQRVRAGTTAAPDSCSTPGRGCGWRSHG